MGDDWITVKVRFEGDRGWWFASRSGRVSRLRLHAGPVDTVERARTIAEGMLGHDDDKVVASRVDVNGRTVARYGEPTPARTVYGPKGGYRYLVAVRNGRGVFHCTTDGRWANVDEGVYTTCYHEAQRAGLAKPLTIHGCTCTIITQGLRFIQESDRFNPVGAP